MNIRQKITFLITIAGLGASLVFSFYIFFEMTEQPFRIMDSNLEATAIRACQIVSGDKAPETHLLIGDKHYWLKVTDPSTSTPIYTSDLAQKMEIPEPEPGSGTTYNLKVPRSEIEIKRGLQTEVTFRVRTFEISFKGKKYLVTIGSPMEGFESELREIYTGVGTGLLLSAAFMIGLSYFIAGLILRPIRIMNEQARDISEQHLDRRIPVGKNRDEFNSLAMNLNQAFSRLQLAFLQQKRLIGDASHELKTPLTLIRLAVDDLRSGWNQNQTERQTKILEKMTEHVLRMEHLVKNLLDLSYLELEKTTAKDPVELDKLLISLVDDYQLFAEMRTVHIETQLSSSLVAEGDRDMLNRVFSNILDNAIKYNTDMGQIKIVGAVSDSEVSVTISNTGVGIPSSEIPKVFDRFYRLEKSRSAQYGGSGLGLAIVKRIVDLHGGKLLLESEVGGWTGMTVTLPRFHEKLTT